MVKTFKIILLLVIIAISLEFIPIKYAVDINNKFGANDYICSFAQVTGGNWQAQNNCEGYENGELFFENLQGKNPFRILDKNFSTDYLEPSGNVYVFTGEVINKGNNIYDLEVTKWEIVYPIQRKSIRMLYASKNFLTVYDFKWWTNGDVRLSN